jgi:N-acetylglucosamine kinase-like BadF-type ATPase
MILIIDSGSFKADWLFLTRSFAKQIQTKGLNPYFIDLKKIFYELKTISEIQENKEDVNRIVFYGAGCSSDNNKATIYQLFHQLFPGAEIRINTDLAGAAKALFNSNKGVACILGTGSNCCFYDGEQITKQTPSLGYILGDEGSGAYMGKELLRKYLYNQLPKHLKGQIEKAYQINRENVLKAIYQQNYPNRYLASFSDFLYTYKQEDEISEIINQSLNEFFRNHVTEITDGSDQIKFVGSIAWLFRDNLSYIAERYKLHIDEVVQSPIEKLKKIHENDII